MLMNMYGIIEDALKHLASLSFRVGTLQRGATEGR